METYLTKTIDQKTESLLVHSISQVQISALGSYLPSKEPSYAILSWSPSFSSAISREISVSFKDSPPFCLPHILQFSSTLARPILL